MKNIIKIINSNLPKGFKLKIFRESNYNIVCNYYLVMYYKCDKSFFLLGKASILRKSSYQMKTDFMEIVSLFLLSINRITYLNSYQPFEWAELIDYIEKNNKLPHNHTLPDNLIEVKI